MAQIGFWSRARAGCGGGLGEAQVIIMEMNVGLGWGRSPAAGRALLNMEPHVIWSGPWGYWPPRDEITVKRAGETTSWWMYYLCKGLIDEAGDSFTEEASARSNLITSPQPSCGSPLCTPTFGSVLWRGGHRWSSRARRPALSLWIEYECEALALWNRRLCFSSRGDAMRRGSGELSYQVLPWTDSIFMDVCLYTTKILHLSLFCILFYIILNA